jgi:hypothetical protein
LSGSKTAKTPGLSLRKREEGLGRGVAERFEWPWLTLQQDFGIILTLKLFNFSQQVMSNDNKFTEPQNWYGYSLVFEHVVNTEEMECDLWKEARVHLSPFNASWMRVFQLQDDGPVRYRVEFDMAHVSLHCMHEIIGAYLFFNEGKIFEESSASLSFRADEDFEWVKQRV